MAVMAEEKEVFIVGGPNGAGKTTFVKQFLPLYVNVTNFINADDIALGLSPLNYTAMNIRSGKLMLELIADYSKKGMSFGFETTLAGKIWFQMIRGLKENGYVVHVFFLDIMSAELAVSRVKYRVESGGHDILEETIRRRYIRSRINFWYTYKELADNWYLFDNSEKTPELIANAMPKGLKVIKQKYFFDFKQAVGEKNGTAK